jgi:hypothetical protein
LNAGNTDIARAGAFDLRKHATADDSWGRRKLSSKAPLARGDELYFED